MNPYVLIYKIYVQQYFSFTKTVFYSIYRYIPNLFSSLIYSSTSYLFVEDIFRLSKCFLERSRPGTIRVLKQNNNFEMQTEAPVVFNINKVTPSSLSDNTMIFQRENSYVKVMDLVIESFWVVKCQGLTKEPLFFDLSQLKSINDLLKTEKVMNEHWGLIIQPQVSGCLWAITKDSKKDVICHMFSTFEESSGWIRSFSSQFTTAVEKQCYKSEEGTKLSSVFKFCFACSKNLTYQKLTSSNLISNILVNYSSNFEWPFEE